MTPISFLGFNFGKSDKDVTSDKMIERNQKFTDFNFPVDVLWLESDPVTYKYFTFNPDSFPNVE